MTVAFLVVAWLLGLWSFLGVRFLHRRFPPSRFWWWCVWVIAFTVGFWVGDAL